MNATVAATIANIENLNFTMAAGSPVVQFTSVSGATNVSVTGSVDGGLDELDSDIITSVNVNNYTKTLTITAESFAGTSTSSPETFGVNVNNVSGTSAGVTLAADAAGAIETFNLGLSGANAFTLAASGGLTATNITGEGSATIRVASALVDGATITNTATGTVTYDIDRAAIGTAATNLNNVSGITNFVFRNADADNSETLVVTGVASGSTITVADDFANASSIVVKGSATSTSDSLTINLDNRATTATDVDFSGSLTVDEVETLIINSVEAGSATAANTNTITTLNADKATAITINASARFATTLAAEDQGMTVDASSSTANVTFDANALTSSTAVLSVVITGGAGNDSLTGATTEANTISGGAGNDTIAITDSASNVASTLSGGEGNDTITGGRGNDTIDGGEGTDLINMTRGADVVTGGAGNDTFDWDAYNGATAVRQVSTIDDATAANILAASDVMTVTINGSSYSVTYGTSHDASIAAFVTAHAANILANHGVTVAAAAGDASDLVFTGAASGASFTITSSMYDHSGTTTIPGTVAATTAAVAGVTQTATMSDFAVGDVIDTAGIATMGTDYYEGAIGDATATTAYGVMVLTNTGYADFGAAEAAVAAKLDDGNTDGGTTDLLIVFLDTTVGYARAYYDADLDTDDNVAAAHNIVNFTGITTLTQLAATMSADSFAI